MEPATTASYPSRLGRALLVRFPQPSISVLNLGVGGQEAPDEAARFKNDVLGRSPSLVVWQVHQRGVEGLLPG
jgi:hypothetical protein